LSDTHGWLDEKILLHLSRCDEVWHAGDIGTTEVLHTLQNIPGGTSAKTLRAVWGNIDGTEIRKQIPEHLRFRCEGVEVWITHIGGRPGRYDIKVKDEIERNPPNLFICGHSHILLVEMNMHLRCLHINPGAAGRHGFHLMRTILLFEIEGEKIQHLKVVELGKRA